MIFEIILFAVVFALAYFVFRMMYDDMLRNSKISVFEYRRMHPDCYYCKHCIPAFNTCLATNKKMSKRIAKKCPCYIPKQWEND